ncbi:hypothetical protein EE612_042134, partial [Oryza sativa]
MSPETFQHHRLEVRHRLEILLPHLAVAAHGGGDLLPEPVLHRRVLDEVGQYPLQRGGRGVGAGAHELGAEADNLAVGEPPPAVLRDGEVHEGVHVAVAAGAGLPPGAYERDEELLLPPPQRHQLVPPLPEHELGDRREEGEDLEAEEVAEEVALQRLDLPHPRVAGAVAEAHVHQEAEHRVLERLHHGHRRTALAADVGDEHVEHPAPRVGERAEAGRVEHAGGDASPEGPPRGAIRRRAHVPAAAGEQRGRRAAAAAGARRERRPALHQRAVRAPRAATKIVGRDGPSGANVNTGPCSAAIRRSVGSTSKSLRARNSSGPSTGTVLGPGGSGAASAAAALGLAAEARARSSSEHARQSS